MLTLKDSYWLPIAQDIAKIFQDIYFNELLKIAALPLERFNEAGDKKNPLEAAILSGRISWEDGAYSGSLNADLSGELRKIAQWDPRRRKFRGSPPSWLKASIVIAASKRRLIRESLEEAVRLMEARFEGEFKNSLFLDVIAAAADRIRAGGMLYRIDQDIAASLRNIGISIDLTDAMSENLRREYIENQIRNIKNWHPKQVKRLREMIQRVSLGGYSRQSLQQTIMDEYGVSEGKARFLARQETSLFMSRLRRERYEDAGVRYYRWRSSTDERTRPMHKALNGRIFRFGDPPVTDEYGHRNEPGEDYNCRCLALPLSVSEEAAAGLR
jgi:SPP1 gp7 family putative phage head morphogenesis protein